MRINLFKNGGAGVQGGFVSNGLTLQGPLLLSATPTQNLHAVNKQYVDNAAYNLNASYITSGVFAVTRLPALSGDASSSAGSSVLTLPNIGISAGSKVKPTVNAKGLVTSGGTLLESDISSVGFNKITLNKPTTVSGYGITDAMTAVGGTITGTLNLHADPTASGHAVPKSYIDGLAGGSGGVAVGDIIRKPFSSTPSGFLRCNGALVDKTTYAGLYAAIGDTFATNTYAGAGNPWQQQYQFNELFNSELVGWSTGTSLPAAVSMQNLVVTKNRVYLCGGLNSGSTQSATVYTAPINSNGTLGTWTTGTSIPTAVASGTTLVTKDRVYIIGGSTTSNVFLSTTWHAPINSDGTLGSWTTGTSLPTTVANTRGVVIRDKVYIFGGHNGSAAINTVYKATIGIDGVLGSWSLDSTLPYITFMSQTIVTKNRVYVLGGNNGSGPISNVVTAIINSDGSLGTWTHAVSLPYPLCYSQPIVTKNKAYLIAGRDGGGAVMVNKVLSAPINEDGTIGTWAVTATLPSTIGEHSCIATSSKIYSLGGHTGTAITSSVYYTEFSGGFNDYSAYYASDVTNYLMPGSGRPWQQQYQINQTQSNDITGWTTGTALPGALSYSSVIVTKNRVYLCGGLDASTYTSIVYTAPINTDGTLGTWTTSTSLPGACGMSQAIVTKNRVYLLGGNSGGTYLNTTYTAPINTDGTLGTWTTGPTLASGKREAQAVVTKNRVYLLGGVDSGGASASVQVATINTDGTLSTWSTGNNLPGVLCNSCAIITKNRIYLLGGINASSTVATVYTASITNDGTLSTWTTGTSLPSVVSLSQVIVTKNKVYLLGGYNGSSNLATVYTAPINADGTLGSWATGTSIPGLLSSSSSFIVNNKVYLAGGYNGSAYVGTVYTATILEGLNDYSPYYDGTIEPAPIVVPNTFALPDYTQLDKELGDPITSYIKY